MSKEKTNLREALFQALAQAEISAKELSERAQVTPAQVSRFKNGKDISSSTLQRLIDALPPKAYNHFYSLIAPQKSEQEIAEQLFELASQLKQNGSANYLNSSINEALAVS